MGLGNLTQKLTGLYSSASSYSKLKVGVALTGILLSTGVACGSNGDEVSNQKTNPNLDPLPTVTATTTTIEIPPTTYTPKFTPTPSSYETETPTVIPTSSPTATSTQEGSPTSSSESNKEYLKVGDYRTIEVTVPRRQYEAAKENFDKSDPLHLYSQIDDLVQKVQGELGVPIEYFSTKEDLPEAIRSNGPLSDEIMNWGSAYVEKDVSGLDHNIILINLNHSLLNKDRLSGKVLHELSHAVQYFYETGDYSPECLLIKEIQSEIAQMNEYSLEEIANNVKNKSYPNWSFEKQTIEKGIELVLRLNTSLEERGFTMSKRHFEAAKIVGANSEFDKETLSWTSLESAVDANAPESGHVSKEDGETWYDSMMEQIKERDRIFGDFIQGIYQNIFDSQVRADYDIEPEGKIGIYSVEITELTEESVKFGIGMEIMSRQ